MKTLLSSVHISCTRKHCGGANNLTAADVHVDDIVACSFCGKLLGKVGELAGILPTPVKEPKRTPAGMTQVEDSGPRKRTQPEEYFVKRAAREAMSPINDKLSAWHSRVAQFAAMAERLRTHGRYEAR